MWKLTGTSNGCGNTSYPDNPSKEAFVFHRRNFLPVGRHRQEIGRIEEIKDDDADEIRHFKHTHVSEQAEIANEDSPLKLKLDSEDGWRESVKLEKKLDMVEYTWRKGTTGTRNVSTHG